MRRHTTTFFFIQDRTKLNFVYWACDQRQGKTSLSLRLPHSYREKTTRIWLGKNRLTNGVRGNLSDSVEVVLARWLTLFVSPLRIFSCARNLDRSPDSPVFKTPMKPKPGLSQLKSSSLGPKLRVPVWIYRLPKHNPSVCRVWEAFRCLRCVSRSRQSHLASGMGWEAEDQEGVNFSVIDFHPILLRLGREGASDIVPSWSREIDEGKIIEHLLIYRIRFITRLLKLREHEVPLVQNSS